MRIQHILKGPVQGFYMFGLGLEDPLVPLLLVPQAHLGSSCSSSAAAAPLETNNREEGIRTTTGGTPGFREAQQKP